MFCCLKMLREQCCVLTRNSVVRKLCLLALALSSCHRTIASPIPDNSPILNYPDQVRPIHLYADNEQSYLFLQITPEGEVSGTQENKDYCKYCLLEIKSVRPSIVAIKGMESARFLCMNSKHHLYGSMKYKVDDCDFREKTQGGYNFYYSVKYHKQLTLRPTSEGQPSGIQMARFIPLKKSISYDSLSVDHSVDHRIGDCFDIEDPLCMKDWSNIISPSLNSE